MCVAIFLFLLPATLAAQPADPNKAQAQASLREGNALLEQGHAAEALAKFTEAFRLFPSPKLHYNIGQAESLIPGHEVQAYEGMSRFLIEAKGANPELRKAAEGQQKQLRNKVGLVSATGDPPDADLLVDGAVVGKAARETALVLGVGTHKLTLRKDAAVSDEQTLTIAGGETLDVMLKVRVAPSLAPPPPPTKAPAPENAAPRPLNVLRSDAGAHKSEPSDTADGSRSTWRRTMGVALASVAAASLLIGIVEHVRREGAAHDFINAGCGTNDLSRGVGCRDLNDKVNSTQTGMVAGYVGAAVLGGGSAYFLLVSPSERPSVGWSGGVALTAPGMAVGFQRRF